MKLYDAKAVARFLDVSERRVRQLRDEKVIAEARPGLYDLIETNHRYINYLRKRNPESEETIDTTRSGQSWSVRSGKMRNTNCS